MAKPIILLERELTKKKCKFHRLRLSKYYFFEVGLKLPNRKDEGITAHEATQIVRKYFPSAVGLYNLTVPEEAKNLYLNAYHPNVFPVYSFIFYLYP